MGLIIGIPPGKNHFSYAGKKVLVRQHLDGSWSVWSNKQKVAQHAPTELRCEKLEGLRLQEAAKKVRDSIGETLTYYDFPREHRTRIRTNNALERVMNEIRRQTKMVGAFPFGHSALMLCYGPTTAHCRNEIGIETIPEHGTALEQEMELRTAVGESNRAGALPRKREKFFTLPRKYSNCSATLETPPE